MEKEQSTQKDATKPDGVLGYFSLDEEKKDVRVIVELKGKNVKNLDYAEKQAFEYKDKIENIEWVILSNISQIRLYSSDSGGRLLYESFEISNLASSIEEIKKLHFLLAKERLFTKDKRCSPTHNLLSETKQREKNIEVVFYKQYCQVRIELFEDLKKQNFKEHPNFLLSKTQKILDRFIFICFVEQYGILPKKIIEKINEQFHEKTWENLKTIFFYFNKGNSKFPIPMLNGGLFKEDKKLNSLKISNEPLDKLIQLSNWNFKSELSINILGHIFEQSIYDLEKERSKIEKIDYNVKKGKQKKDGIFYTPDYITSYIINETLGSWILSQRRILNLHILTEDEIKCIELKKKKLTDEQKTHKTQN